MKRLLTSVGIVVALAAGTLFGQQYPPDPQQSAPPQGAPQGEPDGQYEQGRAVARISVINGDVSVRRGDSGEVTAAALNAPLVANDSILTTSSSRAEVQLDSSNLVRVAPNSEVRFTGLDERGFQIQVATGTVTFRVLRPGEAQAEIDTPSVAVHPSRPGVYRISVREDGTSEITVRSGAAEIYSPKGSEQLGPGRTMLARGPSTDPEFQIVDAVAGDSWDRWSEDRDHYLERSHSYDHMSRDINGGEDLDQYGQWVNDPNYGSVWQPQVAQNWAPYQAGEWVWTDWYGWTWVSADPWGWAPYHYGRWFWGARGWCWWPGAVYGHYHWAPAYVGFFGWGGHVGVGFGFGGLGWVPLAPFEVFHPWWGRGFYGGFRGGFAGRTTIVNNVNVFNTYRNARVANGVTGVNAGNFGRHVGGFQTLNRTQIETGGLVHGVVPVAPTRASLQMSNRAVSGNFPQSRAQNFASHMQTTRVDRVPFEQQQRTMQQTSRGSFTEPRGGAGNSGFGSTNNGWQRPGGNFTPNNSGGTGSSGQAAHGWARFGEPIHGTGGSQATGGSVGGGSNTPTNRGWQQYENSRPNGLGGQTPRTNFSQGSASSGNGQAVHISPPIVQQRTPSYQAPTYQAPRTYSNPSYQAPRNYSPSYQAPRNSSPSNSAPRNSGGGGSRGNSGGGGHSGGGGNHGGHR